MRPRRVGPRSDLQFEKGVRNKRLASAARLEADGSLIEQQRAYL